MGPVARRRAVPVRGVGRAAAAGPVHRRADLLLRVGPALELPARLRPHGDGRNSDRPDNTPRFSEDGPKLRVVRRAADVRAAPRLPRQGGSHRRGVQPVSTGRTTTSTPSRTTSTPAGRRRPRRRPLVKNANFKTYTASCRHSRRSWASASRSSHDALRCNRFDGALPAGDRGRQRPAPAALRAPARVRRQDGGVQRHPVPLARSRRLGDLGRRAARRRQAIERAGIGRRDVDLIILGTDSPDYITPATSVVLQHKLGARRAGPSMSAAPGAPSRRDWPQGPE